VAQRTFGRRPCTEQRLFINAETAQLSPNGFEAWGEVIAHDYEGLVAKEEASLYEAGPTRRWFWCPVRRPCAPDA